jgi:hypothetical protein
VQIRFGQQGLLVPDLVAGVEALLEAAINWAVKTGLYDRKGPVAVLHGLHSPDADEQPVLRVVQPS